MADTDTIRKTAVSTDAESPPRPDKARTLALAAVDEAFQERIKHLFEVLHTAKIASPAEFVSQQDHTANGVALAIQTWAAMRLLIPGGPA